MSEGLSCCPDAVPGVILVALTLLGTFHGGSCPDCSHVRIWMGASRPPSVCQWQKHKGSLWGTDQNLRGSSASLVAASCPQQGVSCSSVPLQREKQGARLGQGTCFCLLCFVSATGSGVRCPGVLDLRQPKPICLAASRRTGLSSLSIPGPVNTQGGPDSLL